TFILSFSFTTYASSEADQNYAFKNLVSITLNQHTDPVVAQKIDETVQKGIRSRSRFQITAQEPAWVNAFTSMFIASDLSNQNIIRLLNDNKPTLELMRAHSVDAVVLTHYMKDKEGALQIWGGLINVQTRELVHTAY